MGSNAEIRNKYDSLVRNAAELYHDKQFHKAQASYNEALKLATDSNMSKMVICTLKYMICCCLYESDKLEDLAEVVNTLQLLDRTVKNRFPAAYCLLAQTHCKLFRFELADMEFRNAESIFTRNTTLDTFYIPGSDTPIKPTSKDDEVWLKIKEECLAYHQPDAICSFPDCNYVTKPYVIPNKNIFLKDPAFNGMVIVNCNNKDQPCVLKFHQSCWKMKKDELYPISKVSDKDILGDKCFTPNCLNSDEACVISSIQVIDQKGELKAHIKENHNAAWPVKPQDKSDKNPPKAAVKKAKVNPTGKKSDSPVSNMASIQQQLLESLAESMNTPRVAKSVHSEDDMHHYDETQVIVVKDTIVDVDVSHDPPEVAAEKSFLFTFFLDYIKNNHVKIGDVYLKFNEYNQDLHLKDLDILGFLLQTNNFEILCHEDTSATAAIHAEDLMSQPNGSFKAKSFDDSASYIDDVYYELMNEQEEVYVDCTENKQPASNYNFNMQDSNFNESVPDNYQRQNNTNNNNIFTYESVGGGDACENMKNGVSAFTSPSLESSTAKFGNLHNPSSPSVGTESRMLKDYVNKLESDLEKIIDENSVLRKEVVDKESSLESFKKERESYQETMKVYEQCYEKWTNFKKEYDDAIDEKLKAKEELVKIMKEKNDLEAKVDELQDPEAKRAEFMKLFQVEYKMLEDALNAEWENKVDILKKSLKQEIEVKMSLLNKLLNTQYSSNKHVLAGYLNQCSDFVEVTSKLNTWLEKTMNVKNFLDNSEWVLRLDLLQRAANQLQSEYSKLLNELMTEKEEKYKRTDISLATVAIPNPPSEKLGDIVLNALNAFYRHQYQMMQNYALKAQAATQAATQAMQYQMHPAPQPYVQQQQQYPYASTYSAPQPAPPMTPLVGITPTTPAYQVTPRTAGPPPNLTLPLQQNTPSSQPLLPTGTQTSTPMESVEVDKSIQSVSHEPSATSKVAEVDEKAKDVTEPSKDDKPAEKSHPVSDTWAQMREAFKTIALNVKEKSKSEAAVSKPESIAEKIRAAKFSPHPASRRAFKVEQTKLEQAPPQIVNQVKDPVIEKVAAVTPLVETVTPAQSIKDTMSIRDDRSDITTLTTKNDSKSQKKVGMDGLVKMLLKKFPGSMECDVIEAIAKIRKELNNALTGISVRQIIEEAKPHIEQSQRLHVIRYFVNDGSK